MNASRSLAALAPHLKAILAPAEYSCQGKVTGRPSRNSAMIAARAIQLLEKEFGGHLFHRERSRIHLTELGGIVQPYLQDATGRETPGQGLRCPMHRRN
jgi:hypothetical protein